MAARLSGKVCVITGSGRSMGRAASLGFKVLPGLAHAAAKGAILSMTRHMAMQGRTVVRDRRRFTRRRWNDGLVTLRKFAHPTFSSAY